MAGAGAAPQIGSLSARRAWIEILKQLLLKTLKASLSARRAWIEMENSGTQADPAKCRSPQGERGSKFQHTLHGFPAPKVALRKESVDRNAEDWLNAGSLSRSLSARRAWIEIMIHHAKKKSTRQVALRKESVDRNTVIKLLYMTS